ncbi:Aste57867_19226 [Aphanomyces stellatus]|uniref:Aste57867_15743 protein n=1 Tax=Aphanomyces stellatus TaxID=120398 RepID=A0A485LGB3_9STRA|nr:hypothetical protein As57867_019162 [Aphanomyces stellatus]KAF0693266.1 hypothetical protein As57867_015687 [Aphanomyces stellatus]VFT92532.1 Aste57867_15743 [Aphanomyces stellatus]VFT95947.1 Aste57867_19226 [Aphanomyces stellatus]
MSTNLVNLNLHPYKTPVVTATGVHHAIQWLQTAPVRIFCCHTWAFDATVESPVQNALYMALFYCHTMTQIELHRFPLHKMAEAFRVTMPPSMHILRLHDCELSLANLLRFGQAIQRSCLNELFLRRLYPDAATQEDDYNEDVGQLLTVCWIHKTTLTLTDCGVVMDQQCMGLFLQQCNVVHLSLAWSALNDTDVSWLVRVMQANTSIRALNLKSNYITVKGAIALFHFNDNRVEPLQELCVLGNDAKWTDNRVRLCVLAQKMGIQALT